MISLISLVRNSPARWAVVVIFALTALQVLFGPMDLTVFKKSASIDGVMAIKLCITGLVTLVTCWGLSQYKSVRETLISLPALMIAGLIFLSLMGASSQTSSSAIPSSIINYINMVFVVVAITLLGLRTFSLAVICGVTCMTLYALYLYYFVPERGVFLEPISLTEFVPRLGGVGHPNGFARALVIGFLLTLYLHRTNENSLAITVLLLLLFGGSLLLTKSRTAVVAGAIGVCLLYSDKLKSRWSLGAMTTAGVLGILGLFLLFALGNEDRIVDKFVSTFSKSNDAAELVTGTGRTAIWAEAIRHISLRPLIGYGFNASPVLLVDHAQSTHNAVLYAILSGGLFAGLLMLCLQFRVAWNTVSSRNLIIRGLSAYICLSCLIEDTVLESIPGPGTLLWFACCLVPVMSESFTVGLRHYPSHANC